MATTYQHAPPPVDEAKEAEQSQIVYPEWPTSKPGPAITLPPSGQRPHRRRSDQMVYEYYDQERGMACEPPTKLVVRGHKGKTYLPDALLHDMFSEPEAVQGCRDERTRE